MVKRLRKLGLRPSKIAKEAIVRASLEVELEKLDMIGKKMELSTWKELKRMFEGGRK